MIRIHRHLLGYAGLLSLAAASALAESAPRPHTADEAIRLAYRNNRDLQAVALETERAASRLHWAGRLNNPELEIAFEDDRFGNDEGEGSWALGLTQAFPFTSRLRKERALRQSHVLLADAELADARRRLAYEVEVAIIHLSVARRTIAQQQGLQALNQEVVNSLTAQAERGEASSLEVTQAAITGGTLAQQLRAAQAEERQLAFALRKLLGLAPDAELNVTYPLDLPGEPLLPLATGRAWLERRPDYVLALARVDEAAVVAELEQARRWEDLSVTLFAEREDATDEPAGLEDNTLVGLGLSIPLPLWDRNQDAIAEAAIEQKAAEQRVARIHYRLASEGEEAIQQRVDAHQLALEISGSLIQLAEKNFADLRRAYAQGQTGLLQVQQAQEQLLTLKTRELEAVAAYHAAAARLRFVAGDYPPFTEGD